MPFLIVRQDITKMKVDAIVNATNNSLLGGGGVDNAIHSVAGPELKSECAKLNGCKTGEAKITNAYNLPCKKVIHTVGPIWQGGQLGEKILLESCYRKSLELAKQNKIKSIAFPLISSGAYGYPKEQALEIARDTIKEFILKEDIDVYLVVYDKDSFTTSKTIFTEVREYIDNNYFCESTQTIENRRRAESLVHFCKAKEDNKLDNILMPCNKLEIYDNNKTLKDELNNLDESFSQMLFRLIDTRGMTDVECYKKANIDRKVFSKIRNLKEYKPSKTTAVAFALALELPIKEAKRLIELAGYSLTHNNKFDIIIEYFINQKKYDVFEINEILFEFDQKLIGC